MYYIAYSASITEIYDEVYDSRSTEIGIQRKTTPGMNSKNLVLDLSSLWFYRFFFVIQNLKKLW